MNLDDVKLALTGDSLEHAIRDAKQKRKPIAEGFLYEKTILMITADPGIGKSTISTQIAIELAAGLPVFGVFRPPRPMKVLYAQTERSILEFLERAETIGKVIPLVKENLYITEEYQKFNLLNENHADLFIECVLRDCPGADIIFIDPIYCMVSGGLKEDRPASAFTKAMSNLQKATSASLYYNHHNTKATYTPQGQIVDKEDPFYGSVWLKAHCTGMFSLKQTDAGVKLLCKKDNYKLLPRNLVLDYDPETELCSIPLSDLPALERLRNFLDARDLDKKEFYFKDMESATKLCTRTLRELVVHSSIKGRISVVSSIRNKKLYKTDGVGLGCAVQ